MKQKQIWKVVTICVLVVIVVGILINLMFKIYLGEMFKFEDKAGPVLGYAGTVFGGIGTITLGWVAYKQNEKLQAMEDNNYIATNSSMILVDKMLVKNKKIPINYDNHQEQILNDRKNVTSSFGNLPGYEFNIEARKLGEAIPSLIHISACNIFAYDREGKIFLSIFTKNISDSFSRIAICKDKLSFAATVLFAPDNSTKFDDAIKDSANLVIEFEFCTVTDKYVATKGKCRSTCKYNNFCGTITWESTEPIVFFYGHEIMDNTRIKIMGEKENGQT